MGQIHAFCALSTSIDAETEGLNSFNFEGFLHSGRLQHITCGNVETALKPSGGIQWPNMRFKTNGSPSVSIEYNTNV